MLLCSKYRPYFTDADTDFPKNCGCRHIPTFKLSAKQTILLALKHFSSLALKDFALKELLLE